MVWNQSLNKRQTRHFKLFSRYRKDRFLFKLTSEILDPWSIYLWCLIFEVKLFSNKMLCWRLAKAVVFKTVLHSYKKKLLWEYPPKLYIVYAKRCIDFVHYVFETLCLILCIEIWNVWIATDFLIGIIL